jgi:Tfp pilus assembly protein PilN
LIAGLCVVIAALIVFPELNLRSLKREEQSLTNQLSQLNITDSDVQRITMELMVLVETANSTEQFALLAEQFSALMVMTQADDALTSGTGISELAIDGKEITISGRSSSSRSVADYAEALRKIELFDHVQFTSLESRGDYTHFGMKLILTGEEEEHDEND